MKYAIILVVMFFTNAMAKAETCTLDSGEEQAIEKTEIKTDVPKHLIGATITVTLANGKSSTVPAEKFKVVPRLQQYLVTKVSQSTVKSCVNVSPNKNRVSALAGYGATGHLDRSADSSSETIESSRGVVGGAQYQRLLNDHWSLGVQVQGNDLSRNNKTGLGSIGYDF